MRSNQTYSIVIVLILIGAGAAYFYTISNCCASGTTLGSMGAPTTDLSVINGRFNCHKLGTCSTTSTTSMTTSTLSTSSTFMTTSSSTSITTSTTTSSTFTGGSAVIWIGANGGTVANRGIYSLIDVVPQSFGGCLSFWISDASFSSGMWGQVGYFICSNSQPTPFAQIWDLNANSVVHSFSSSALAAGQHNFSMYLTTGTTWAYAIDSHVIGTWDMKSNSPGSYEPIFAMSEQNSVAGPNQFQSVTFTSAINVKTAGWSGATTSTAYIYPGGSADWSIAGRNQIFSLLPNQVQMGYGLSGSASSGQVLW